MTFNDILCFMKKKLLHNVGIYIIKVLIRLDFEWKKSKKVRFQIKKVALF